MFKDNLIRVGENIKRVRKEKNIRQSELAKKLDITDTTMSRIENGTADIKLTVLYNISHELDTTLKNLLYGADWILFNKEQLSKLSEKV